jgi:hypothetical protein
VEPPPILKGGGQQAEDPSLWRVDCENMAECPGFVGQVLIRRPPNGMEWCTGFLINSRTVVTNSHCVPEPENCASQITVHFPATRAFPAAQAACDRVIAQSRIGDRLFLPDYAVFELKSPVNREAVTLDKSSGVRDNEELKIVKIDPVPGNSIVKGYLKVRKVHVVYGTFSLPTSNGPDSAVQVLVGGEVIPGNSGSPVLTADLSKVKLITFAILDKKSDDTSNLFKRLTDAGPDLAYATNATCLGGTPEKCRDVSASLKIQTFFVVSSLLNITAEDHQQVTRLSLSKLKSNPVFAPSYSAERIPLTPDGKWYDVIGFQAVPGCIEKPSSWKSLDVTGDSATVTWPALSFKKQLSIDERGKIQSRIVADPLPSEDAKYSFSPRKVRDTGQSLVQSGSWTQTLGLCSAN